MKQFYGTYKDNYKLSPLVRELPWIDNTIIIFHCKSFEQQEFYIKMLNISNFMVSSNQNF
ncbi:MAG: hypothetical protein KBD25_00895 [Rickettsiaceae bacterium]|nr:hypothetical protein [Rickettsiaceae bacterium]